MNGLLQLKKDYFLVMEIKAGSGLDWNDATGMVFTKNDIVWTDFAEVRTAISLEMISLIPCRIAQIASIISETVAFPISIL